MENNTEKEAINNFGPNILKPRNKWGLLPDAQYIFNENGFIDWRKMIKPEFLVPNKQVFERRNKPVPETIDGLEDRDLLILLGGIKELAHLRGYYHVSYNVKCPSSDYVVAVCSIEWMPNYETEYKVISFSAIGDASLTNTSAIGRNYLGPIAENRAFVRCVRNFLKINIVSQEEIGGNGNGNSQESEDLSSVLLKDTLAQFNISFETLKEKLIQEKVTGAEGFTSVADIPRIKQFELIERIKRKNAAKASQ